MRAHTPREDVVSAVNAVRAAGGAEVIVSIGGGSVTDGSKAVCMALEHDIKDITGFEKVRPKGPPNFAGPFAFEHEAKVKQIAVPTTLSGGEFTGGSGVTRAAKGPDRPPVKQMFLHPNLQPVCVIFDPALSVHTPEWLWLSTGIRAVDHCAEAICSVNGNYVSNSQAAEGLSLLSEGLPRCKQNPKDLEARLMCQIGCWKGCAIVAMAVEMGGSHAIGHTLGGTADVPHGYTSCINLPYVLEYNSSVIPEKTAAVAKALGRPGEAPGKAMDDLIRGLGMPRTLGDIDFPLEKLDDVAKITMTDHWTSTNPRPLPSPKEVMEILEMAKKGKPNKDFMVGPVCVGGKPVESAPAAKL